MHKVVLRLFAVLGVLALAACSSSGTLRQTTSVNEPIRANSVAALEVHSGSSTEALEAAEELRARLFGTLVSQGLFTQVVPPAQPADYKIAINLSGVSEVSQGARIFFGVLAGSNTLSADVKLIDQSTGATTKAFVVGGESASHPLSSENGMDDAIREAASKIVQALR